VNTRNLSRYHQAAENGSSAFLRGKAEMIVHAWGEPVCLRDMSTRMMFEIMVGLTSTIRRFPVARSGKNLPPNSSQQSPRSWCVIVHSGEE
jgi:hypothetical protein